jgi:nicotinamidase/pyrazinamidase
MTAFLDVDTQNDFILASGALAVPGAEALRPALAALTKLARERGIRVFGSVDRHFGTADHRAREGELRRWDGPFPDHCMDSTPGQAKIPETAPADPLWIPNTPRIDPGTVERAGGHRGEVYLEKQSFSVFDNPNAEPVLRLAGRFVVYGVATDYCVRAAVLGLRKLGREILVVRDAIAAVNVKPGDGERAIEAMASAGAGFVELPELLKLL